MFHQTEHMRFRDYIEDFELYEKMKKGSGDKKPDKKPEDWGPFDYFLLYTVLFSIAEISLTLGILHIVK